jgi:hypothetical protein
MDRRGFTEDQIDTAWIRQNHRCPCYTRSLSHVGCGWDAHHRNGNRSDNRTANLLLVCTNCHHNCYHDERGISRQPRLCRVVRMVA